MGFDNFWLRNLAHMHGHIGTEQVIKIVNFMTSYGLLIDSNAFAQFLQDLNPYSFPFCEFSIFIGSHSMRISIRFV